MSTPFLARMSTSSGSFGSVTAARRPSTAVSWRDDPSLANRTRSTLPFCTALMNSEYRHVFPSGSAFGSATAVDGAVCESASENADLADCWNCASADVGASAVAGGAKSSAIATRLVAPDAARNAMKDAAVVARVLSCGEGEAEARGNASAWAVGGENEIGIEISRVDKKRVTLCFFRATSRARSRDGDARTRPRVETRAIARRRRASADRARRARAHLERGGRLGLRRRARADRGRSGALRRARRLRHAGPLAESRRGRRVERARGVHCDELDVLTVSTAA